MSYNAKNYTEQGGERTVIGGELDIVSGGSFKVAGNSLSNIVQGIAAGYKLARGSTAATASVTVATGLTSIVGFALSPVADTATKINTAVALGGKVSAGNLTIKRYKHTGPSTATLAAATVAGTVNWLAVGT